MKFTKTKIGSDQLFQLAFHLVLWSTWIAWPLIHAHSQGGERSADRALWFIPLTLAHIPLFLINTELLIPRVLRKKGVTAYLVSLLVLIGFFATFQYFFPSPGNSQGTVSGPSQYFLVAYAGIIRDRHQYGIRTHSLPDQTR